MTYITIPTAARALSSTIAAEAAVIRRACNTWTTPAALEAAERAADRMAGQISAMKAEIAKARRAA
jgi:hypothetical protein